MIADPALPLMGVHHISREVRDLEATRAFYREVLGFREIVRPALSFPGAWLFGYGVQIHLIVGDPPPRDPTISSRVDHIAFHSTDLSAIEERLRTHGVPYKRTSQTATGLAQLFFQDPDGNHLEAASYPPTPAYVDQI